ncbi:DUF2268 domain-containing protein [Pseudomonas japonica]|uniref:DUF2268 domain-containing protein n=1 Tax=Pseudomonas japonica TaxID=256466 RepID=UPI0015E34FA4|nr:DUF2268 domain-containing putative Zn-dependent protease [Pseudomonas japonica]MBA1243372.1 DUF2268 domain-containing protein [Pseudomonas japonica]MBA1290285.1 DUF2268 domain-containing protein [Pseudomonas japonica]
MTSLTLHFLDARGALTRVQPWLQAALTQTHAQATALMPLPPVDVILKAGAQVIPEKGHLGYAPEPGVIYLTVDPGNPILHENINASLERMFAHELHHCARWEGPGYGRTLGEALVSEGLAGHFAQEVCAGPPEPWECLALPTVLPHVAVVISEWDRPDYDHAAWFFGTARLPRWVGYSLGYQVVARFIKANPGQRASTLAAAPARDFLKCLRALA